MVIPNIIGILLLHKEVKALQQDKEGGNTKQANLKNKQRI